MICSLQRGKEALRTLISEFESLKCSRRLELMNHRQMCVRKVDLCLPVCPVLCFGFLVLSQGREVDLQGGTVLLKAEHGTSRTLHTSFISVCHCPWAAGRDL